MLQLRSRAAINITRLSLPPRKSAENRRLDAHEAPRDACRANACEHEQPSRGDNTFPAADKAPSNSTMGRDIARNSVRNGSRSPCSARRRTHWRKGRGIEATDSGRLAVPSASRAAAGARAQARARGRARGCSALAPAYSRSPSPSRPPISRRASHFPRDGRPDVRAEERPREREPVFVTSPPHGGADSRDTLTRRDGPLEDLDELQRRWVHLHG